MDKLYDCFSSPFYQPVGATADLKELEYISALLQTGGVLRSDGSLTAEDVAHYLLSRHGIRVTPECIKNTIFQVFGVGNMENGGRLDLLELTAILIIPILLIMRERIINPEERSSDRGSTALDQGATQTEHQQQQQKLLEDPKGILRDVLSMMYIDSRIPCSLGEFTPPRLTEELIQQILRSYGMHDLGDDATFIREMIISAKGQTSEDDVFLDEVLFLQALTSDVKMFKNEGFAVDDLMLSQSSPSDHISKSHMKKAENALHLNEDEEEGESNISSASWQKVFTAKVIDFTSDNYTSVIFVVCLWVCFFLFFIAYLDFFDGIVSVCNKNSAGCRILNLVVSLIAQALTLM
jgi:hypothetical protein